MEIKSPSNIILRLDRVLVNPDPPDDITAAGIFIPEKFKPKAVRGQVVSIGPGLLTGAKMETEPGLIVIYPRYTGTEITINNKEYLIIPESDISLREATFQDNNCIKIDNTYFTPLSDRLLIEPEWLQKVTPGGIILPDTAVEKSGKALVLAVGKGKLNEPMTVRTGDHVLYEKHRGTEITVNGKECLIIRESEIYLIFKS